MKIQILLLNLQECLGIGRIIFFLGFVPFGKASCAIQSGQGLEVDSEFPDPLPHPAGLLGFVE